MVQTRQEMSRSSFNFQVSVLNIVQSSKPIKCQRACIIFQFFAYGSNTFRNVREQLLFNFQRFSFGSFDGVPFLNTSMRLLERYFLSRFLFDHCSWFIYAKNLRE